jgi:hypothetical protein
VAEKLQAGVDATYSIADATDFDGIVLANDAGHLFLNQFKSRSTLYPAGRPYQILQDAYRFGKPIAFAGNTNVEVTDYARIPKGPGIYFESDTAQPVRTVNETEYATKGTYSNKTVMLEKPLKRAVNGTGAPQPEGTDAESTESQQSSESMPPADIAHFMRRSLKQFRFLDRFHHENQ